MAAHLFLRLVPLYSTFWLISEGPPQPRLPRPGCHPAPLPPSCSLAPWATTCMPLSMGSLHSLTLPAWVGGPPRPAHMALILQYCTCLPGTSSSTTHVLYLIHSSILPPSTGLAVLQSCISTTGQLSSLRVTGLHIANHHTVLLIE